jgi:hypothetical protein
MAPKGAKRKAAELAAVAAAAAVAAGVAATTPAEPTSSSARASDPRVGAVVAESADGNGNDDRRRRIQILRCPVCTKTSEAQCCIVLCCLGMCKRRRSASK